ncbi:7-carboxy-7-deazaguanine synthase QueE [Streptomyces sp. CC208A]|uniref:7-carboxy-7-deazaguanine synthase QueE n=1 Tax=Streptomyces sp. CC208A TaxID=3044573 RepID=UPI0024A89FA4|nr:7-carboxy-7-deazaguanine synthase QueE [Streptomyces sp. CC208A]
MLKISQLFGPTVQGEGSAAGRHCLFVRLFDCNLECTYCDTAYTWAVTAEKAAKTRSGRRYDRDDPAYGLKLMGSDDVLTSLRKLWDVQSRPTIIVVSGGEPMMQQQALFPVLQQLRDWGNEVHIETAGTIPPTAAFDSVVTQYNVSPKLANSGNRLSKRYKPAVLAALHATGKAWFKFVITDDHQADLAEVDRIVADVHVPVTRVMVMPEGSDGRRNITTAQQMVDAALTRGYGLSFRTHVLLWNDDPDR